MKIKQEADTNIEHIFWKCKFMVRGCVCTVLSVVIDLVSINVHMVFWCSFKYLLSLLFLYLSLYLDLDMHFRGEQFIDTKVLMFLLQHRCKQQLWLCIIIWAKNTSNIFSYKICFEFASRQKKRISCTRLSRIENRHTYRKLNPIRWGKRLELMCAYWVLSYRMQDNHKFHARRTWSPRNNLLLTRNIHRIA